MIKLKRLLYEIMSEDNGSDNKPTPNILFIGDIQTTSSDSYAKLLLSSKNITGKIAGWKNLSARWIPRVLKSNLTPQYNVVVIMIPGFDDASLNAKKAIDNLAESFSLAKKFGAKLIVITNPTTKWIGPEDSAFKQYGYPSNNDIAEWANKQGISDVTIDTNSYDVDAFDSGHRYLSSETQSSIAKQIVSAIGGLDLTMPDVDTTSKKDKDQTDTDTDSTSTTVSGDALVFISQWKDTAIKQMEQYGIPASITLAQAALESAWGGSRLATQGNNYFGIKCHNWSGETITADDDAKGECFRKYKSADQSFKDHSKFIKDNNRYKSLFKLAKNDYEGWAEGLEIAGYATSSGYGDSLISIIKKYGLNKYDSGESSKSDSKLVSLLKGKGNGKYTVTSPFGVDRGDHIHAGTDFRASVGTPLTVNMSGTILRAGNWNPTGWGNCVEIKHEDGTITRYAHLSSIAVNAGDSVKVGDSIGATGGDGRAGSGNSKTPHLHWEYIPTGATKTQNGADVASKYFAFA